MKPPNQFELAHAAEVCRRLMEYIHSSRTTCIVYDIYLLGGAANTIDEFIENEELTFFERIPNDNTETKKTTTPTPDTNAGIGLTDSWLYGPEGL